MGVVGRNNHPDITYILNSFFNVLLPITTLFDLRK